MTVHLGEWLRVVREASGLTQEKAAVAAGLTRNTLVSIEGSRFPDPKLSTLLRLMRTYGLGSLEELLGPPAGALLAEAWEAEGWQADRRRSQ
jgi:transcriptional regulator with XRE-family HTH domain